jgi:N-acetylglucosaminyldiphosphoundecaprenol N-acetyl-beta-D-mannosaminyltransferase
MSTQTKFPQTAILGVEVDCLTTAQAIEEILSLSQSSSRHAYYVVKPYVEYLDRAYSELSIKHVLNQAYLSLPDGVSLNWASYFYEQTNQHWWNVIGSLAKVVFKPAGLDSALPNHAWGTSFTFALLQAAAKAKTNVFLVGAPKHSRIGQTQEYLAAHIKDLNIVGTYEGKDPATGRFSHELEAGLYQELQRLRPDIILVGIGFPAQDQVIARLAKKLDHGVLIGEGGTFDYQTFGGQLHKAPAFMQRHGLEWLWRLGKEPWRLQRQLAIPRFIYKVYKNRTK